MDDQSLSNRSTTPGEVLPAVGPPASAHEEQLLAVLDGLPESFRDAILWRHRDRLSYEQIAVRAGLSAEAARQLYRQAIALLARDLPLTDEP